MLETQIGNAKFHFGAAWLTIKLFSLYLRGSARSMA
jgi:hypothetical protein